MQYYIDLTTEQFQELKNHESKVVRLSKEKGAELTGSDRQPMFTENDTLKVYHPSKDPEALRFAVTGPSKEGEDGSLEIPVELLEWMAIL